MIVPYGERGQELVNELCGTRDLEKQYRLFREAQRYSVNCVPQVLLQLSKKKAIHEIHEGSGVYYLERQFYDEECGLHGDPVLLMDVLTF